MEFNKYVSYDTNDIKRELPITFILYKHNIGCLDAGSRLTATRCPAHTEEEQTTPSFSIYENRFNCFACGARGDVFDLMQLFDAEAIFSDLVSLAKDYLVEIDETQWVGTVTTKTVTPLNPEDVLAVVKAAQSNKDNEVVNRLIRARRHKDGDSTNRFSAQWLRENFEIGVSKARVVVPYKNRGQEYVAYKDRVPGQKIIAAEGAKFTNLFYNEWRTDNLHLPCLIVEGEGDTWNAQYEIGDTYRVLGVATGSGTNPHSYDHLSDTVYLAFDGDAAGRNALRRWSTALTAVGKVVLIVAMPEGKDVATCGPALQRMCVQARPILTPPTGLSQDASGYFKSSKDGKSVVSNWTFTPTKSLVGEVGGAFEGILSPGNQTAVITTENLRTKNNIITWSHSYGRTWLGSDRDAAILLGMLQAESVYLPLGRLTTVAGLNDGSFVLPTDVIGSEEWAYIPPGSADISVDFFITPGNWEPDYIHTMRDIHQHNITDPILAWLAIAPLRTVIPNKEFPLLQITGEFGAGKTTSVEALVRGLTGTYLVRSLATSTPYSIKEDTASTSSFPIVFEEKRLDGRQDTLEAFDRLARNAYNMLSSRSGGASSTWSSIATSTPTAPLIVSGEDTFSDGALIERMIMINFHGKGNEEAFNTARSWESNGLPYVYLSWLHRELKNDLIHKLNIQPEGPTDLAPRIRTNIGILYAGWRLLQRFMEEAYDGLDEPDFSGVISTLDNARKQTPIENGIRWCLGEPQAQGFVYMRGDKIYVKVENFVSFISQHTRGRRSDMSLPGGTNSVINYLKSRYNAKTVLETTDNLRREFLVFDALHLIGG